MSASKSDGFKGVSRLPSLMDLRGWRNIKCKQANAGIIGCMQRWVQQRSNIDTAGELMRAAASMITSLNSSKRRFIHIHKVGKQWQPVKPADKKMYDDKHGDGYIKQDPKRGELVLLTINAWQHYCANAGGDHTKMAEYFRKQGTLIPDKSSLTRVEPVLGGNQRFYVLYLTN
jgi:hypothetical protein